MLLYATVAWHSTNKSSFPDLREKGKKQSKPKNIQNFNKFQQLSWFASEDSYPASSTLSLKSLQTGAGLSINRDTLGPTSSTKTISVWSMTIQKDASGVSISSVRTWMLHSHEICAFYRLFYSCAPKTVQEEKSKHSSIINRSLQTHDQNFASQVCPRKPMGIICWIFGHHLCSSCYQNQTQLY